MITDKKEIAKKFDIYMISQTKEKIAIIKEKGNIINKFRFERLNGLTLDETQVIKGYPIIKIIDKNVVYLLEEGYLLKDIEYHHGQIFD